MSVDTNVLRMTANYLDQEREVGSAGIMRAAADELDALRNVVAKFPRTADGEIAIPGERYYANGQYTRALPLRLVLNAEDDSPGIEHLYMLMAESIKTAFYSTREAALNGAKP